MWPWSVGAIPSSELDDTNAGYRGCVIDVPVCSIFSYPLHVDVALNVSLSSKLFVD